MTGRRLAGFLAPCAGLAAAAILVLSACTTVNMEDAFAGAAPAQAAPEPAFSEPGDYPNLNVIPAPAAPQLTEEQKATTVEELRARRQAQAEQPRGSAAGTNAAALRRLGDTHADDALRVIEGN